MKKRLVQTIAQSGNNYGQVSNPLDLIKAEDYVHERVNNTIHDFLNRQKANETTGFDYVLVGGNSFDITIKTPGRIYSKDGIVYDLLADAQLTIQAADTALPRLDLVVAVLEDNVDAALATVPFVRLRTTQEFTNGVLPYAPTNLNVPTEKHWRAVPQIKTGTPAAVPTIPALNSNEVPLYLIAVAPNAAAIRDEDIADWREIILSLREINDAVGRNSLFISILTRRVEQVEILAGQPIDLSYIFGTIRTLGDILASHERQIRAVRDLPDVRFNNPKVALTDPDSSKIPASGGVEAGIIDTPIVNIEIGGRINFGDTEVIIRPDQFADSSLNARFAQVVSIPANVKTGSPLTIANVTQTATDGFTDFIAGASSFTASRARPACAARNSQFIETFGGLASDNSTPLGDWLTYDTLNDTLTPRTPLVALPDADRPAMISYGDGTHVLLICGKNGVTSPRCFKLNGQTGGVTEITTTKPTGVQFFGDVIAPGKLFIVAIRKETSGFETDFWEFDITTNQFTQLGVTGSIPTCELDYAAGCFLAFDQFLLVKFTPGETASGRTYFYTRSDSTWRELNIAQPYNGTIDKQDAIARFKMANVNGRPILIGGLLTKETDPTKARIWEFAPLEKWNAWNGTFPPIQDVGFCSVLGVINGIDDYVPYGTGIVFGGQSKFSEAKNTVYRSVQGGLIATTYKGQPAISISDTSTFVEFTVPVYNAPWDVAGYLLSLVGAFTDSNIKVEVSFNNGTNYHVVKPDDYLGIQDSSAPGVRLLRVTFYNYKTSKPILSSMTEIFDQDGSQLESRLVIRYDSPSTTKALYVNRDGVVTLSSIIEPSTPDKAILHKITPDGTNPPTVKNYINRRRPHIKYSKVESGSLISTQFENELAVPARYVDARAVKLSDKSIYKINDPVVSFDGLIDINGVSSGDTWIVEVEG